MPVLQAEQLKKIGTEIFVAAGASVKEAKMVSEFLVKSNLAGHDSHGVIRIIQYVKEIEDGLIKPGAKIEVVRETESTALLNGNWGFGQVVAKEAMEMAIEKARDKAASVVCAFNCNHVGRLADYTEMALTNDMIGIAMVNSVKGVAPYGGADRMLSTGPISYAFPTGTEIPFVLDIATSVAAEGKLRVTLSKGGKLQEGWIIDKEGYSSVNPEDFYNGGALLPLGGDTAGHKGFGLGLVVDVLSGILSRAGCAYQGEKKGNGVFFEVMDIQSFVPLEEFKAQMSSLIRAIKSSRVRPGFKEIMFPGEPEVKTERVRLREGIYVPEKTWEEIGKIAKKLGVNISDPIRETNNFHKEQL